MKMDNNYDDDEQMELPPGFRFHPTDEELISHYLYPKIFDTNFVARAIGEVDLNKIEPWDLPWNAKMGEEEWYFFSVRDRKYPTGMRTNRATEEGYWKATGKDKEIYEGKSLVGMKKTLVFYKGRAPNGIKTNWVMHEYRLDGKFSTNNLPKSSHGDWVISRVFQKSSGGKKIPISGLCRMNKNNNKNELMASNLPPLMELTCINGGSRTAIDAETSQTTCYSKSMEEHEPHNEYFFDSLTMIRSKIENDVSSFQNTYFYPNQMVQNEENLQYQETVWMQDPSIFRILIDNNNEQNMRLNPKIEMQDDPDYSMNLDGPLDLDSLWN